MALTGKSIEAPVVNDLISHLVFIEELLNFTQELRSKYFVSFSFTSSSKFSESLSVLKSRLKRSDPVRVCEHEVLASWDIEIEPDTDTFVLYRKYLHLSGISKRYQKHCTLPRPFSHSSSSISLHLFSFYRSYELLSRAARKTAASHLPLPRLGKQFIICHLKALHPL